MAKPRTAHIEINEELSDEDYADLMNTIWMLLRSTGYEFGILPDTGTSAQFMNERWDSYGQLSEWH